MSLAEGIREHGFRNWYERERLRCHGHLALLLVCMIGIVVALEAASRFRSWGDPVADGLSLLLYIGVGLWSLRRYLFLLLHAEAAANQANCTGCKAYGHIELLQSDAAGNSVKVRGRKYSHVWRIGA